MENIALDRRALAAWQDLNQREKQQLSAGKKRLEAALDYSVGAKWSEADLGKQFGGFFAQALAEASEELTQIMRQTQALAACLNSTQRDLLAVDEQVAQTLKHRLG